MAIQRGATTDLAETAPIAGMDTGATSCAMCGAGRMDRPAAARCRFCSLALCTEHLAGTFQPAPVAARPGCRHIFVAAGWLAEAVKRPCA